MAMIFLEKLWLSWLFLSNHFILGVKQNFPTTVYTQEGDVYLAGLHVIRDFSVDGFCGTTIKRLEGFQLFLGAVYAIEKIKMRKGQNGSHDGLTLGMIHLDSCHKDITATGQALRILPSVPGPEKAKVRDLDMTCEAGKWSWDMDVKMELVKPLGLVGPIYSNEAQIVSNILQLYQIPLVSPTASDDSLSDRVKYPNFYRATTPTSYQARVMGSVLNYFQWTYFSIVYEEGAYGFSGLKSLRAISRELGLCVANSHAIAVNYNDENYNEIIDKLRADFKARVVAVICNSQQMKPLFRAVQRASAQGEFLFLLSKNGSPQTFQGVEDAVQDSFLVNTITQVDSELEDYVYSMSPSKRPDLPWLAEIWEQHLDCSVKNSTCAKLEMRDIEGFSFYQNSVLSSNAVFALSNTLDELINRECPEVAGNRSEMDRCLTGTNMLRYIKNATVHIGNSAPLQFNEEGFPPETYQVIQLQINDKGTADFVRIAVVEATNASLEMTGKLRWSQPEFMIDLTRLESSSSVKLLNTSALLSEIKTPESMCAKPCRQGEFYLKGTVSCCWDCKQCRDNEVVTWNGTSCDICELLTWPSEDKSTCAPISPAFLTWESWYSIGLLTLAGIGVLLTLHIWYMVLKHRSRKVIKGGNWTMMLVILLGLVLAFGSVVLFVAMPTDIICIFGRIGFSLSCTLIFAPVLVKTNSVYQVFEAAARLSRSVKLAAPRLQKFFVTFFITIQIALVLASHLVWPVSARRTMPIPTLPYVELACEQDLLGLLIPLSYNILILIICSILGFLTRKLPDNYNESWYIFICVSGTLFVWAAFLPTYFSAFYAYHKATLLAFALILNGYATILCFFAPKIYAVLYVDEKDVKISFMDNLSTTKGSQNDVCGMYSSHATSVVSI